MTSIHCALSFCFYFIHQRAIVNQHFCHQVAWSDSMFYQVYLELAEMFLNLLISLWYLVTRWILCNDLTSDIHFGEELGWGGGGRGSENILAECHEPEYVSHSYIFNHIYYCLWMLPTTNHLHSISDDPIIFSKWPVEIISKTSFCHTVFSNIHGINLDVLVPVYHFNEMNLYIFISFNYELR